MLMKLLEFETEFTIQFSKDSGIPTRLQEYIKSLPKSERKWNFKKLSWTIQIKYLEGIKRLIFPFTESEENLGEQELKEFLYQFEDPL